MCYDVPCSIGSGRKKRNLKEVEGVAHGADALAEQNSLASREYGTYKTVKAR